MQARALVRKIRSLLLDDSAERAAEILESQLEACETHEQMALIAHQLAKVYCDELRDESGLAADYALLAGKSYLVDRRVAPAVAVLKLLANCPNGHFQYKKLQKWIEESTSPSDMKLAFSPKARLKSKPRLEDFPLFSDLSADQIRRLMKLCTIEELPPNTLLFSEGDDPEAFYVVYDGEMRLESSYGLKKIFREGDFFGELALFGNMKRTATLKTLTGASLLTFSEKALTQAFSEWPDFPKKIFRFFNLRLFLNAAQRSPFFKSFSEEELIECYSYFTQVIYPRGSRVMLEGALSESLYLIVRGECEVTKSKRVLAKLGPGQFVGEVGLLRSAPRNATVTATKDSILLNADRVQFDMMTEEFPLLLKILQESAESRSDGTARKSRHSFQKVIID